MLYHNQYMIYHDMGFTDACVRKGVDTTKNQLWNSDIKADI